MIEAFRGRAVLPALLALLAASCSAEPGTSAEPAREGGSGRSVKVENCGEKVAYEGMPRRAVTNESSALASALKMLVAPGVEEKIVGFSGVTEEKVSISPFEGEIRSLPILSRVYFAGEVLLGAEPDLVVAGRGGGFSEEQGITPESLAELGLASYTITEECQRRGGELGEPQPIEGRWVIC